MDYRALGSYGYLGVFLITLVGTAGLVVPVPYLGAVVVAGTFLDPLVVGLVAGGASALGELTGYVIGRSGSSMLPPSRYLVLTRKALDKYGIPVLFAAALVPNPLFDVVGILAGAGRMPVPVFVGTTFVAKTLRLWLFAGVGGTALAMWLAGR